MSDPSQSPSGEHRYNDDLLLKPEVREQAQKDFPHLFHVLDDEAFRDKFLSIDARANQFKLSSHLWGISAVILAAVALIVTAGGPIWREQCPYYVRDLECGAAALGILAVIIGAFGVMYGERKFRWLRWRFYTERMRQFRFQQFVCRTAEIIASMSADAEATKKYLESRRLALGRLIAHQDGQGDADFNATLNVTTSPDVWLYDDCDPRPVIPESPHLAEFFKVYRTFRFDQQIIYAEHQLREEDSAVGFTLLSLRRQRAFLRAMWGVPFAALVFLHLLILVGFLPRWEWADNPMLGVFIIWLAVTAVAAKTLEEGLALGREIERYEEYRATTRRLRDRFDKAEKPEEKLEAMVEMERVAYDEMCRFLRSHHEATFVL